MKPHKHCELIKAWADGAVSTSEIEFYDKYLSKWVSLSAIYNNENICFYKNGEYRIKPEPKPDVVRYYKSSSYQALGDGYYLEDAFYDVDEGTKKRYKLKTIWDGETGELKSAEVLK